MHIFKYGQKEIEYLKEKDKKLGAAIERIGMIERKVIPDPFKWTFTTYILYPMMR